MSATKWLNDELAILLDFTGDIYRNRGECIRNGNIIDYNAGIVLPWSKRSDIDTPVKERMRLLVNEIDPKLFYEKNRVEWCINFNEYPDLDSAIDALQGVWESRWELA